jgi:hypothetical protein
MTEPVKVSIYIFDHNAVRIQKIRIPIITDPYPDKVISSLFITKSFVIRQSNKN